MTPPISVSMARWLLVSISAIVAGCAAARTDGEASCDPGQSRCNSGCVDMASDVNNCGVCGNVCPTDQQCIASVCKSTNTNTIENTDPCPEPTEQCAGVCIDTTVDAANCGACSHACPQGQTCNDGVCGCPDGYTLCGDVCVDIRTDIYHCGGCGQQCSSEETCIEGSCACQKHLTPCDGVCVDLQADGNNCGLCGHVCEPLFCGVGLCASSCPSDTTPCGTSCVNLDTDVANCGACGVACPSGQSCMAGVCDCAEGSMDCGATAQCTNLQTDIANCGSCGAACLSGQTCANGVCACTVTGQTACSGACVSLTSDPLNCGACGVICASGKSCSDGACVGTAVGSGGTGGGGGVTTGGRIGGRGGGTAAGGTPSSGGVSGGGSVAGGYHVAGVWKGKAWTSTDTAQAASISPANFDNLTTDGPYCASGTVPVTSDYSAVAMIGFNVNQASTTDAPANTWTPASITTGGVVVNVTNRGANTVFRVQLLGPNGDTVASDRWCYELTQFGRDVTIPWSSFNTECWQGGSGVAYDGQPIESVIVLVPGMGTSDSNPVDRVFDFCVNDIGPA